MVVKRSSRTALRPASLPALALHVTVAERDYAARVLTRDAE